MYPGSPYGMYPGMGMPPFFPGMGDTTPSMGKTKSTKSEEAAVTKTKSSRGKRGKRGGAEDEASPGGEGSKEKEDPLSFFTLQEVMPKLVDMAKDEKGSKFLKAYLEQGAGDAKERSAIVDGLVPAATDLAMDALGNQVLQAALDTG